MLSEEENLPPYTAKFALVLLSDGDITAKELKEVLDAVGYKGVNLNPVYDEAHECPCPSDRCLNILREQGHVIPKDIKCCNCWFFGKPPQERTSVEELIKP